MAGTFELYVDKAEEFRFRLKSAGDQIILVSEGYKAKPSASNGIDSVRKNASADERYERKQTSSGKFMFNLKSTNGQVIGTSEQYPDEASRDAGIAAVRRDAPDAALDDQTS